MTYRVFDLLDETESWIEPKLEGVRDFLFCLWINDEELEGDDPIFKEIAEADIDELRSMLEGCDYSVQVI